jgi:hypothetical protein
MGMYLLLGTNLYTQEPEHEKHEQMKMEKKKVEAKSKKVTIMGELLDTSCFFHGISGAKHKKCAHLCMEKGFPMSILSKDKTLYLLLPDHSNEEAYETAKTLVGDIVEIKGMTAEKNGLHSIMFTSVKKMEMKTEE